MQPGDWGVFHPIVFGTFEETTLLLTRHNEIEKWLYHDLSKCGLHLQSTWNETEVAFKTTI